MMRSRRFPLVAVLIVVALGGVIGYMTYIDVDVPSRAWAQVVASMKQLGQTVTSLGGIRVAQPQPDHAAQAPTIASQKPMLVNASNQLPEGYAPHELVRMKSYCDPSVVAIKGDNIEGEKEAVDALMVMLRAAIADGLGDWQISAGYRSLADQQQVWDSYVSQYQQQGLSEEKAKQATAGYVATPGASEHHTGLAFDITVPGQSFSLTEQSKWIAEHCWEYGFILRYTEEKQAITGINAEPWHVRYVGLPHATTMRDQNLCLEEYVGAV